MKRSERRLLEEKLRYVAMEDIELDPEREQQILEQARESFMRQAAEAGAQSVSGGHRIGRRVLIVSAAAVLIVVLSFGFAILAPESVSHAKGFVRSAAIWVNNTLHLGYEFEEPMENTTLSDGADATYTTLEEAAANIPYPLVYLDDPNFELQSITTHLSDPFTQIVLLYSDGLQNCRLALTPVGMNSYTDLNNNDSTTVPWQCGELICWESADGDYALTYYASMEISVESFTIPYNDFLKLCQMLKAFN